MCRLPLRTLPQQSGLPSSLLVDGRVLFRKFPKRAPNTQLVGRVRTDQRDRHSHPNLPPTNVDRMENVELDLKQLKVEEFINTDFSRCWLRFLLWQAGMHSRSRTATPSVQLRVNKNTVLPSFLSSSPLCHLNFAHHVQVSFGPCLHSVQCFCLHRPLGGQGFLRSSHEVSLLHHSLHIVTAVPDVPSLASHGDFTSSREARPTSLRFPDTLRLFVGRPRPQRESKSRRIPERIVTLDQERQWRLIQPGWIVPSCPSRLLAD